MSEIYQFTSYREFLASTLLGLPNQGRGGKSALAKAAKCQLSYMARILKGRANLSLEQGDLVSQFLGLRNNEHDYFLLLIQFERAGTNRLKDYFWAKIKAKHASQLHLKKRFNVRDSLDEKSKQIYYSSWHYSAAHVLISLGEFQTPEAIARKIQIPIKRAKTVLDFLVSAGLAKRQNGRTLVSETRIHLGVDSPLVLQHHLNWRARSIESMSDMESLKRDLHYTAVVSLSKKDYLRLKAELVLGIEKFNDSVKKSSDEDCYCFCLDFYQVGQ